MESKTILTIFGLNGGFIFLSSKSFHFTSLKNGWCFMASSPPWFWNISCDYQWTDIYINRIIPWHNRASCWHSSAWTLWGWRQLPCSARQGRARRHGGWTRTGRLRYPPKHGHNHQYRGPATTHPRVTSKGGWPAIISYMSTPRAHQSTLAP